MTPAAERGGGGARCSPIGCAARRSLYISLTCGTMFPAAAAAAAGAAPPPPRGAARDVSARAPAEGRGSGRGLRDGGPGLAGSAEAAPG